MTNKTSIIPYNEYVIVDIETTGFSVEHCSITQIAALKIKDGNIVDSFNTYVKQNEPIPSFITRLTGITDQDTESGLSVADALYHFTEFTKTYPIIGHNVSFDYRFLDTNLVLTAGRNLNNPYLDTLRFSKELLPNLPSYKLDILGQYLNLTVDGHHNAVADTRLTYDLIVSLSSINNDFRGAFEDKIRVSVSKGSILNGKKVALKTKFKKINPRYLECVLADLHCQIWHALFPSAEILIINDKEYDILQQGDEFDDYYDNWKVKAKTRQINNSLKVYKESEIIDLMEIPYVEYKKSNGSYNLKAKEFISETDEFDENHSLYKKKCVFTGVLDKFDRKTAMQYVVNVGGYVQDCITKETDYLILGDNSFCKTIKDGKSTKMKRAEQLIEKGSNLQVIPETTFYHLLMNE